MHINIHGKVLPVPSFFQVYNYGGGNGDKDREIVYAELTGDTPALLNYYYINNRYPHIFSSHYFDNATDFDSVGDLYNDIRRRLIEEKHEIFTEYNSPDYDFNSKVFLLDSGAFNIVKNIAETVEYDASRFENELISHMKAYYDFADALKFDIVVGFDLGGKYTEKDGEKDNSKLVAFLRELDKDRINNLLTEETIKYLKPKTNYYPKVLATVHGYTQEAYADCTDFILDLERNYCYQFFGFALGGIASYKQVDESWYGDIDFRRTGKRGIKETVTPARAVKIVRAKVGDRYIHALGCGGYPNIAMNYFSGATSFDSASPVRRVGDGGLPSTKIVFDPTPSKIGFSKYFTGGINDDGTIRNYPCKYVKLNEVDSQMEMCGCPACREAGSVLRIKQLYAMKETDDEANYFSRQLMGLHAVMQHRKLCETISSFDTMQAFCEAYPSELNQKLSIIFEQL